MHHWEFSQEKMKEKNLLKEKFKDQPTYLKEFN